MEGLRMASTSNSFNDDYNPNSLFQTRQDNRERATVRMNTMPATAQPQPYKSHTTRAFLHSSNTTQHNTTRSLLHCCLPYLQYSDGRFPSTTSPHLQKRDHNASKLTNVGPLTNAVSSSQPLGSSRTLRPYVITDQAFSYRSVGVAAVAYRRLEGGRVLYCISDILSVSLIPPSYTCMYELRGVQYYTVMQWLCHRRPS